MALAKPELGTKRTCVSCSTRFYDLTRTPAVCPKCSTEQPIETPRPRRSSGGERAAARRPVPVPVEAAELPGVDVEAEPAAEEEGIEDAADLEGDDADLDAEIEVEDEDEDGAR